MAVGIFDWVCDALEEASDLNRLEARGTMRLALKAAGLDPRTVKQSEMLVVVERLLPKELAERGIDGEPLAPQLADGLRRADLVGPREERPDDVFRRLGA